MKVHASGHALARQPGSKCEDAWVVRERGETVIAVLADGVGASREGGAAAHRVVATIADHCLARPRTWTVRRALAEFTTQINRQLHQESLERHGSVELACTLSAVVIENGRLFGCNIGDSPVFHWRQGRLQRLSVAHVLAQPNLSHVLTQGLGLGPEVEPHFFELEIADGDLVLICSDGITAALTETRIGELLARRALARMFVSEAHAATEEQPELRDDVSAIAIDIVERSRPAHEVAQRLEVPGPLHAGDAVDGHRLVRPLAPTDRVWLATDPGGAQVVLKFPPLESAGDERARDAFVREAWNSTRLVAPELVRAWTPDTGGTVRCYAMEFIDAPTLRTTLKTGRLSVEHACELAAFLLRTGQFLVRHDLAHGDIKPENILVLPEAPQSPGISRFRVLDLGSAAELFSVTSRAGTPSYLAPERFRGGALSERTEIFAIGVTLYEALTGTYPYGEIERFQNPRFETPPRQPSRLNPAVPLWLESIVLRALEPEAEHRYQNFSELTYDLSHPDRVAPHHRKGAPLLERNPLLLFQLLLLVSALLNLFLLFRLAGSDD
ncbi:MAG: protein phosphatase 2C domain-containing protein [Opitutaceae bacterium]